MNSIYRETTSSKWNLRSSSLSLTRFPPFKSYSHYGSPTKPSVQSKPILSSQLTLEGFMCKCWLHCVHRWDWRSLRSYVYGMLSHIVQTIIPLVFVFLPYFCSITFPLVKLSFAILSPICIPLISFFPSWDALIVVGLIKEYRIGVRELFKPLTSLFTSNSTKVITIAPIGQATSNVARTS